MKKKISERSQRK